MKFEQADFNTIERTCTSDKALGYIVTLGGKTFNGYNGRQVFKNKQSAMCALNNAIKWRINEIVMKKLEALGMTRVEIIKDAEYLSAYKNFVTQAKASGFLQVIELKR